MEQLLLDTLLWLDRGESEMVGPFLGVIRGFHSFSVLSASRSILAGLKLGEVFLAVWRFLSVAAPTA